MLQAVQPLVAEVAEDNSVPGKLRRWNWSRSGWLVSGLWVLKLGTVTLLRGTRCVGPLRRLEDFCAERARELPAVAHASTGGVSAAADLRHPGRRAAEMVARKETVFVVPACARARPSLGHG